MVHLKELFYISLLLITQLSAGPKLFENGESRHFPPSVPKMNAINTGEDGRCDECPPTRDRELFCSAAAGLGSLGAGS